MANTLYDHARELFLTAGISWTTDTINAVLVDSTYVLNTGGHLYYDDVAGSAIVAGPVTLSGKATTGGAADANDVTYASVSGSDAVNAIILYKDTGTASTSPLIAYLDTATGLPITPNGGDIIVTWDNGANKIFRL